MNNKVIELTEGKDYEMVDRLVPDTRTALVNNGDRNNSSKRENKRGGILEGHGKRKAKKQPLTIFSSLSYMLAKVSEDKDEIFRYLEAFLQSRPQTKENISLAYAYTLFSGLNDHERKHTTYEDLIEITKQHFIWTTYHRSLIFL